MPEIKTVRIQESLLAANDDRAAALRERWRKSRTLAVNLLSSPGSGKTSLLEHTLPCLAERARVLVIEGDVETDNDAERIRRVGVEARQITTGGACHLDARMVERAWDESASTARYDYVFVENVGNLVCPASYDLGEHRRVVLLSVPEGEDKPAKYPRAFRDADLLLVTKIDLLPYLDFRVEAVLDALARVMPRPDVLRVSARNGEGVAGWIAWLESRRAAQAEAAPTPAHLPHHHS